MNLSDLLGQQARVTPAADAIVHDGGVVSFAELEARVCRYAARLAGAGLEPGRLVGLSLARIDPLNIALALALARIGAVSVPLAINLPAAARAAVSAQFELAAVIAEDPQYAIEGLKFVQFHAGWAAADGAAAQPRESFDRPMWPWRLHLSSGTTSRRLKGVLESHDSLVHQVIDYKASGLAPPEARFLLGLPMTVASGIRSCLRYLMNGNPVVFPRSLATGDLIEAIERHRATHATLTQITVRDLLGSLPKGRLRFPGTRLIVGGFATPPGLVEEMADRIAPQVTVVYGASEVGWIAFANLEDLRRAPGSVGRPITGIKVQIVDEQDRPAPAGEIGIVRVRGIALPNEYFKDPQSTQKVFRGGWVYPGDYGRMDGNGYLWLESRVDDVVKVAGWTHYLPQVDRVLAEHPQVLEAAAFMVVTSGGESEVLGAVVAGDTLDELAVLQHCRARLGPLRAPKRLYRVAGLPRNESGKVMRHELARQLGGEAAPA